MTEKRFYIKCDEYNAWSVWEKDKDVVVFDLLKYDAEVVCKALNELNDENEQLKKELQRLKKAEILANQRGELIGFATSLIEDLGSKEMCKMWSECRIMKYKEWREMD